VTKRVKEEREYLWSKFLCEGCDKSFLEGQARVVHFGLLLPDSLICPKCSRRLANGDQELLAKLWRGKLKLKKKKALPKKGGAKHAKAESKRGAVARRTSTTR
jgi:hypothetical protein